MAFRDMRWCRACTGAQCWKHLACMERRDDFIFGIPHDRAGDLEQMMREVSTVKICERIRPGFLTAVEFLHRKVGWSAEGFSSTHDPKHTHWQWLMGLVSTARSNSSERSGTSLWFLVRKPGAKVCVTVRTTWWNNKHNSTGLWWAQHCMLDRTDQKRNTQRKKQRYSCPVPRALRSVCSNVFANTTARHPYSDGVFHVKECRARSEQ